MTTRMLIDARHPEETRVAVLKGNRIDEFDFESAEHKQIKGNIYLAKVTRVEPSLQAAFVDFGGNRHGFLAFSEIHPDYYQIPKEDREALLAEEAAHAEEEAALRAIAEGEEDFVGDDELGESLADDLAGTSHGHHDDDHGGLTEVDTDEKDEVATIEDGHVETAFDHDGEDSGEHEGNGDAESDGGRGRTRGRRRQGGNGNRGHAKEADELRAKRMALRRRYKIQDVIQRRQVLLVQVVKEERGNKGAALTTYLSLAGRYCVLMPNSSHGGGISRKISSAADRKRLKTIIAELDLPKSMGCIVRTAGLQRTKTEIKRDFDYLARLWDGIRETTLKSTAPALIHSDSDLIKRAIRDIYNREIEDVVVEGEHGYRAARDFMKLLMPSHAKRVKQYADPVPLFQRYGAEDQLTAMYDPEVQLKSGGYIVINPTEALVSIDINSGRSTKEHGIEATALNTNLEAAREIARQLRLRDMAGLVVIDFIDMEYNSNVRKVEKAMKDALKNDRARIQVGRISSFGLMEMSRQRLRTGVLEATTRGCPHCDGTGLVRTASSAGLSALRLIEDEAAKGRGSVISLFASTEAAVYLLNAKRGDLAEIEERYGVRVEVLPEGENEGAKMRVGSSGPRPEFTPKFEAIAVEEDGEDIIEDEDELEDDDDDRSGRSDDGDSDGQGKRRRKRRRRGGQRDRELGDAREQSESAEHADDRLEPEDGEVTAESMQDHGDDDDAPRKRRRRGRRRRGGRGRGDGENEGQAEGHTGSDDGDAGKSGTKQPEMDFVDSAGSVDAVSDEVVVKPKRPRRKKPGDDLVSDDAAPLAGAVSEAAADDAPTKPKRTRKKKVEIEAEADVPAEAVIAKEAPAKPKRTRAKKALTETDEVAAVLTEPTSASAPQTVDVGADDDGKPRRGWWQRTFGE
ncbi:ribonuclease E/G [Novosphingobium sp.]|uniref:Rne/Rng family ribonuclease n=1 Tax=Novosphingobium sp. TaxID=1874826 RepID=UPI0025F6C888|nr:ribonuclease E/G [Novosphingobium sp.]